MLACIVARLRAQTYKYLSSVSNSQVLGHVQVGATETLASSRLALHVVCGTAGNTQIDHLCLFSQQKEIDGINLCEPGSLHGVHSFTYWEFVSMEGNKPIFPTVTPVS